MWRKSKAHWQVGMTLKDTLRSADHFSENKSASAPNWKTSSTGVCSPFPESRLVIYSMENWGKGFALPFWKLSAESSARKPCSSWAIQQILLILELVWPHFLPNSFCCLLSRDSCEHRFFWVVPWATFLEPNVLISQCCVCRVAAMSHKTKT